MAQKIRLQGEILCQRTSVWYNASKGIVVVCMPGEQKETKIDLSHRSRKTIMAYSINICSSLDIWFTMKIVVSKR